MWCCDGSDKQWVMLEFLSWIDARGPLYALSSLSERTPVLFLFESCAPPHLVRWAVEYEFSQESAHSWQPRLSMGGYQAINLCRIYNYDKALKEQVRNYVMGWYLKMLWLM
jgi:hypothetical protein